MDIKSYFDEAIRLELGSKVIIPCFGKSEQESIRTQLFRMRRRFTEYDSSAASSIGIYKSKIDGRLVVVIEKRESRNAFVIKKDGSMEAIKEPQQEASDLPRIVSKAIGDGVAVQDLIKNLDGVYSAKDILNEMVKQKLWSNMCDQWEFETSQGKGEN